LTAGLRDAARRAAIQQTPGMSVPGAIEFSVLGPR